MEQFQQTPPVRRKKTWKELTKFEKGIGIGCGGIVGLCILLLIISIAVASNTNEASTTTGNNRSPYAPKTPVQQLTSDMQSVTTLGSPTLSYAEATHIATITDTIANPIDISTTVFSLKSDCFGLQKQLWQSDYRLLSQVTLNMIIPTVDKYGNAGTAIGGSCTVTAETARLLNWSNLDNDTAWSAYDSTYLSQMLHQ